jgi:hypothetical protein
MRSLQRALVPVGFAAALGIGAWIAGAGAQDGAARPASSPSSAQPVRIATADVLGIVERMILSDRYRPAQESFANEQNNKLKPMADELVALENRGSQLPPNSPDLETLSRQFEQKRDEFQRARQEALAKIDAFNTDQMREAYRLTLQAVNDMAQRQGYTHVFSSRTGPTLIRSDNVAGGLQEILARPMAFSDPADDLTDRIIHDFKLENVNPSGPAPAPASAPSPTQPPPPAPPRR